MSTTKQVNTLDKDNTPAPACKSFEVSLDKLVRAYKQAKYGTCAMREASLAFK
jgi:hypothetical protein